jgi:hypothetical protein
MALQTADIFASNAANASKVAVEVCWGAGAFCKN